MTVAGVVLKANKDPNGELYVVIKPDEQNARLAGEAGALVVEISGGEHYGPHALNVGNHVKVTGAYVRDTVHGWLGIHPVYQAHNLKQ